MAYFLFVAPSGPDTPQVPYEVVAGVAVEDRDVWNLAQALGEAEVHHFGRRLGRRGSRRCAPSSQAQAVSARKSDSADPLRGTPAHGTEVSRHGCKRGAPGDDCPR